MGDANLNMEPIGGVDPHDHNRRRSRLPQWLAILIVALALVTLVLMIMLISAAQESARTARTSTGTASEVASTETTETETRPIIVVKVTEWITENGALGANSTGKSTTQQVSTAPAPEPEAPVEPVAPAPDPSDETKLTGVDEDVATARARAQGLKPYSVYGFPAIAVSSGASLPPAGQVFRWEPFSGRVEGEKFAFLYVQTTESRSKAVTVPSVQGKTWQAARSTLLKAGLNVRFEYEHESPSTYGTVVFQAPESGSLMPTGCSVVLVLAD